MKMAPEVVPTKGIDFDPPARLADDEKLATKRKAGEIVAEVTGGSTNSAKRGKTQLGTTTYHSQHKK